MLDDPQQYRQKAAQCSALTADAQDPVMRHAYLGVAVWNLDLASIGFGNQFL